jgi:two-component system, response regulator PdtaR
MPSEHLPPASPVILLVEDDVLLRWVIADSLRESGFAVVEAANSAEAVRVMEATPIDALFSDIDMPGRMDGLALAQWVHQRRFNTKIILTSGVQKPLGDAGKYASFLPKPYADDQVEHLLRSVLPSP